ncbi:MAG TPA: glycosyltransferase [Elusimicrobiota bacterium]|jgi:dolichol-phosphate mannosyltransferase|nr:glycosyltransferase [Elusimicrobiota bacterium]
MSAPAPDVSVVIPVIDEAAAIGALIAGVRAQFERLGVRCEVLAVDGGSKDGTPERAAAAGARVLRQAGPGYGAALAEGFAAAAGAYVLTMDGDGSHSPEAVPALWARRAEAEVVVGSRLVEGGGLDETPAARVVLSRVLNEFFRRVLGFPVRDSSSGYRLYRAGPVKAVRVRARGFDAQQDILLAIVDAGGRAVEVPIRYVWRKDGVSKASIGASGPGYLRLAGRRLARLWRRP